MQDSLLVSGCIERLLDLYIGRRTAGFDRRQWVEFDSSRPVSDIGVHYRIDIRTSPAPRQRTFVWNPCPGIRRSFPTVANRRQRLSGIVIVMSAPHIRPDEQLKLYWGTGRFQWLITTGCIHYVRS